jgi:ATP-dependent RNA helicase RhlE
MQFNDLGLHAELLRAIAEAGYTTPTPIQEQAIPHVLAGHDVMGAAQTGTGKTAAFTLPILHRLIPLASASASPARHPVRALMLAPTRELADQIYQNVSQYARYTQLRSTVVFGGMDMSPQTAALRNGVEILIATPGRLLDHVQQKTVNLSQVSLLVLDEADRMLDMGFLPDLQRIVNLLPASRQSLLFSATFSPEIRKLAKTFLKDNPVTVEVARRNATAENVTQKVYKVDRAELKRQAVVQIIKQQALKQVIVFTNTKIGASRLARELIREGIAADAIHGDKSQNERLVTLENFKQGQVEVLVATDVAARGLDIAELPAVINYDIPYAAEDYVHRIGRTGRAGASGQAISLMTSLDERLVSDVEALVGRKFGRESLQIDAPEPEAHAPRGRREERSGAPRRDRDTTDRIPSYASRSAARLPVVPADPLFSQPYQEPAAGSAAGTSSTQATAQGQAKIAVPRSGVGSLFSSLRKPGNVPVLLGGKPK